MLSLGEYTTSDNEFSNTGEMELNSNISCYSSSHPEAILSFTGDEIEGGGSTSRLLPPNPSGIMGKKPISGKLLCRIW